MRAKGVLACGLLAAAALAKTGLESPNWEAAGKSWWAHVRYLADDKLQGRAVGTPGFELAADYVASQFHHAGLDPAVRGSYAQPVAFIESKLNEPASGMTLLSAGAATPAALGETVLITSQTSVDKIEAPLVFTGYGLDIPEAGYSDLKGLPLRGAIAVYLSGGPGNVSSDLRSHHASGGERGAAMRAAGVIGTIQLPNPRSMDIPWERQIANHLLPRMMLAETGTPLLQFTATWNPAQAERLFDGSGHTFAEILDAADHDRPLPHFALNTRMREH